MRCPFCGEPIETRHTFCTVCGADLQRQLPRPSRSPLKSAAGALRSALTKPIELKKSAPMLAPELRFSTSLPELPAHEKEEQSIIMPDFMKRFVH